MSNKKGRAMRVNRLFARLRRCALLFMTAAAAGCDSNDDNQAATAIEQEAKAMGFRHAACGPLVRSSYHADEQASNAGIG